MKKLKKHPIRKYFRDFKENKDGFEFLQLAIVIAIVAVMAVVVWQIATSATKKLEDAQTELDKIQIQKH